MKTLKNTLAERKDARWGRRAGLAYAERVGDGSGGEVGVREDNHGCTRKRLTNVRRCWGAQRIEAEGVLGGDLQQILSGDYGVEKAVAFDAAVKIAEVDEYGPHGHVGTDVQSFHFARDLFLDFAPDFVLALRFDDIGRAGRLDQEIDLTAAAARVTLVAIGGGGDDNAVAKMQVGENLPEVVDDQVLELKAHRRMLNSGVKMQYCTFTPGNRSGMINSQRDFKEVA